MKLLPVPQKITFLSSVSRNMCNEIEATAERKVELFTAALSAAKALESAC